MSFGGEVITIHIGPYANYIGANLWNLTYVNYFKTASEDFMNTFSKEKNVYNPLSPLADSTRANARDSSSSPSIEDVIDTSRRFFRLPSSKQTKMKVVPRAIFCDYPGAVPKIPISQLSSKVEKANHKSSLVSSSSSYDQDHFAWEGAWSHSVGSSSLNQTQNAKSSADSEDNDVREKTYTWHDVLFPFLRPTAGVNLLLAPPSHMISSSFDSFGHGSSLANSVSGSDAFTYIEEIEEAVRSQAEDCDALSAFHVIVDADSAWAGLGSLLLQRLCDSYGIPILVFAVSHPLDIFDSAPATPLATVLSCHEYSPMFAQIQQANLLRDSNASFQSYMSLPICLPQYCQSNHLNRVSSLALLVSSVNELKNVLLAPLSLPWSSIMEQQVLTHLFGRNYEISLPSAPSTLFSYATAPTLALSIYTLLVPVFADAMSIPQLIGTISPRAKLFIATLAHFHTTPLLGGTDVRGLPILFTSFSNETNENMAGVRDQRNRNEPQTKEMVNQALLTLDAESTEMAFAREPTCRKLSSGLTLFSSLFSITTSTKSKSNTKARDTTEDGSFILPSTSISVFCCPKLAAKLALSTLRQRDSLNQDQEQAVDSLSDTLKSNYLTFMANLQGGRGRFGKFSLAIPSPELLILPPKFVSLSQIASIFWPFQGPTEEEKAEFAQTLSSDDRSLVGTSKLSQLSYEQISKLFISENKLVYTSSFSHLFTSEVFKGSFNALALRIKDSLRNPAVHRDLRVGFEEDELLEAAQLLTILADDYLE